MLVAVLTIVALMQLDPNAPNGIVSVDSSYVAGERLDFSITRTQLGASPTWSPFRDDPPLAPRQAIRSAQSRLSTLVSAPNDWRLSSLSMRP